MGYDVKVNKTEFERWFSIWNWHRLMALVLFGWSIFDDDDLKRELTIANNLQHHDAPTTPEEEEKQEKFRVEIAEEESESETQKGYFLSEWKYTTEGRIIGGVTRGVFPSGHKPSEKTVAKITASMMASNRMIAATNDMLFDHKEQLGLKNNACRYMTTIGDGKDLEDMHIPFMLGIGAAIGMARASKQGRLEAMGAMITGLFDSVKDKLDGDEYPAEFENFKGMSTVLFDEAHEHKLSFELDEYWSPDELGSMAAFIAVMMDAAYSFSLFEIT
tara:strand:- start:945 stop:1766 length:822 start_codon:yes stop_codon:yes gene_type:complete